MIMIMIRNKYALLTFKIPNKNNVKISLFGVVCNVQHSHQ